ncbi:MAG: hypothetical protein KAT61_09220 [Gammaproteobacteria bacterium]|nr:hypothetical protein [Gammaproteobacteria bacterium]
MKKIFQLSALALLPASTNLCAGHPMTGIVDEEAYTLMDSHVADTSNANPGFDEIVSGIAKTSITIDSLSMFETMVASGDLLEYIELQGGVDNASISFNDNGSVTMTVNQAG